MADNKHNSDSDDESDEDYVPDEKTGNVSEEADSGDAESDVEADIDAPKSKRRRKANSIEDKVEKPETKTTLDVDSIWADFKKDTEEVKKKPEEPSKPATVVTKPALPVKPIQPTSSKGGGGLANILGKIGKKDKLSTLEKSRLDWNNFKTAEGIDDDLRTHNRGKDGFLERRDFLERTDLRQFEIEKELRTVKRSNR